MLAAIVYSGPKRDRTVDKLLFGVLRSCEMCLWTCFTITICVIHHPPPLTTSREWLGILGFVTVPVYIPAPTGADCIVDGGILSISCWL